MNASEWPIVTRKAFSIGILTQAIRAALEAGAVHSRHEGCNKMKCRKDPRYANKMTAKKICMALRTDDWQLSAWARAS